MKRLVLAVAIALLFASASVFAAQSGAKPSKPQSSAPAADAPKPVSSKPAGSHASAPKTVATQPKPAPRMVNASAQPPAAKPAAQPAARPATQPPAAKPSTNVAAPAPAPAPAQNAKTVKAEKPPVTAKADTKPAKADSTVKPEPAVKVATKASKAPAPGTPLTPIQEKLAQTPSLARKIESRLPAGTNVMAASEGFKNLGQFVAAVNVSQNLNIPFDKLREKVVTDRKSLGQAIQALRPTSSGTIEAQRAEYDARGMIAEAELEAASKKPAAAKPLKPSASPRATGGRP
jgi:hypothetical protein